MQYMSYVTVPQMPRSLSALAEALAVRSVNTKGKPRSALTKEASGASERMGAYAALTSQALFFPRSQAESLQYRLLPHYPLSTDLREKLDNRRFFPAIFLTI